MDTNSEARNLHFSQKNDVHMPISTYNGKANFKVELVVKMMKNLFWKAKDMQVNPYLAMLDHQ